MKPAQFEEILQRAAEILTDNARSSTLYHGPDEFEQGCLDMLKVAAKDCGVTVGPTFQPRAFPDIKANGFGVEVKYSKRDTWHAVGNSVFEGIRDDQLRLQRWLQKADCYASKWKPSDHLFLDG